MSQLVKDSVPAGGTVLDVGAGPGEPTTTMANSLPSHIFVTTDSQEAMVEKAKVRAQGLRLALKMLQCLCRPHFPPPPSWPKSAPVDALRNLIHLGGV